MQESDAEVERVVMVQKEEYRRQKAGIGRDE